jgi:hypothetical protein
LAICFNLDRYGDQRQQKIDRFGNASATKQAGAKTSSELFRETKAFNCAIAKDSCGKSKIQLVLLAPRFGEGRR